MLAGFQPADDPHFVVYHCSSLNIVTFVLAAHGTQRIIRDKVILNPASSFRQDAENRCYCFFYCSNSSNYYYPTKSL